MQNLAQQKNKTLHLGFITLYSDNLALMKKEIEHRVEKGCTQTLTFVRENYQHIGASASSPFDILYDLGVRKIRLMTNNPKKVVGLNAHKLEIVEQIPIKSAPNPHNERYLDTKRDKLGHKL